MAFVFTLLVSFFIQMMKFSCALRHVSTAASTPCADTKVVVVIGGGAAGYFSAIECARLLQERKIPSKVYALEAGRSVLSKVLISGGGRCNVMHNPNKGPNEISKGYPRGSRELLGPLNSRFSPDDTYNWFTSRGVTLKTEKDGRVFPTTDRSSTIADTLENAAKNANVDVICGAKVTGVTRQTAASESAAQSGAQGSGRAYTVTFQRSSGGEDGNEGGGQVLRSSRSSLYEGLGSQQREGRDGGGDKGSGSARREKSTLAIDCDRVIMATGSSRLGYDIVRGLGHSMLDPLPSLFSFKIQDEALTALSGVSCKHTKLTLVVPKKEDSAAVADAVADAGSAGPTGPAGPGSGGGSRKKGHSPSPSHGRHEGLVQRGPLLVTRQGLSGPAALKLSAFGARVMSAAKYRFDVEVSWVGDLGMKELVQHLSAQKKINPNRLVSKCFPHLDAQQLLLVRGDSHSTTSSGSSGSSNKSGGSSSGSSGQEEGGGEEDLRLYEVSDRPAPVDSPSGSGSGGGNNNANTQQPSVDAEDKDNIISKRLWLYLLDRQGLGSGQLKWCQMSAQAIQGLAQELTKGVYTVNERGQYRDEFVTCGGVSLKEVHFGRMESRLSAGLFLAGELLDVDGVTGGYNFQSAWTTGYIAGHHCALSLVPQ